MDIEKIILTGKDLKKYGVKDFYDLENIFSLSDDIGLEKRQISDGPPPPEKRKLPEKPSLTMRSKSKIAKDTGRIVKGFAGTIEKDRVDDIIPIQTFVDARKDLLKSGSSTVFFNHDTNIPIGIVNETAIDESKGLFVELFISKAADVESIWTKIDEGILNSFSVRLKPEEVEMQKNKQTGDVEAMIIKKMKLLEVSVVGIPANAGATVTEVLSKSFDNVIKNYNNTKEENNMENPSLKTIIAECVNDTLKSTVQDSLSTVVADINKNFDSKFENIQKQIDEMKLETETKSLEEAEYVAKQADEDAEEVVEKSAPVDKQSDNSELVLKALAKLTETVTELSAAKPSQQTEPTKKGVEVAYEQDKQTENDGTPRKVLKSSSDPDTIKYLFHVMENDSAFEELNKSEQEKANCLYFQAYNAMNSKGE